MPVSELPATIFHDRELFATENRHLGPRDFMLMHFIDHGGWLQTAGLNREALRAIIATR